MGAMRRTSGPGRHRIRTFVSMAATATVALVSVSTADATEIFRRAASVEERVGRVELRRAYGARLQVVVDCEEDVNQDLLGGDEPL